jgi:hypothetical protein
MNNVALAVPALVGFSDPVNVRGTRRIGVQLYGTFVATIEFQVSFDKVNWTAVRTMTAPDVFGVDWEGARVEWVRWNTTAYTSSSGMGSTVNGEE